MRTIYLENDDISKLRREVEEIMERTEEERAAYEAEIALLQEEWSKLDAYARAEFISEQEIIDQL